MKKLIILDYSDGSVNIYEDVNGKIDEENFENAVSALGYHMSNCHVMLTDDLTINFKTY